MKVLVNAINFNAVPRGPDRYLLELLPHMLATDPALKIDLVHAPWQLAFVDLDLGARLTTRCLHPPRHPALRLLWQAARFPRIANRADADVVFLPNMIWTPGVRAPIVVTVHDLLQFRAPEKFGQVKAAILRMTIKRALVRAHHLIAVSNFTCDEILRFVGIDSAKVTTILEGGPPAAKRSDAPADKFFLFVGKLERTKGIDTLVRAFLSSEVLRTAGFRLLLVGPSGNAITDLEALIAGEERIVQMGFVPDADLEHLYKTCRAFVFPSTAEGFGLVLLEAMARGAPVIAADATSLPEVMDSAGLLVPPRDEQSLRMAMENIAEDDDLFRNLQSLGYARLTEFSWETAARETVQVLRRVCA